MKKIKIRRDTYGVFTLPDTEANTGTNIKIGCIESRGVCSYCTEADINTDFHWVLC